MYDMTKINDIEYLNTRTAELLKIYNVKADTSKIKNIMRNTMSKNEALQIILQLVTRTRTYHLEFLTWRDNPRNLPLILECLNIYSLMLLK